MKKALKIIWSIVQVLIIIYVILVIVFMLMSNRYGYSEIGRYVLDVDNNEFIVIKKTDDIKDGDLVYYYSIVDEKYRIIYSNIKSINEDKTYTLDNKEIISRSKIIGKSHRRVPIIGYILNSMKYKINFFLFCLLPILIVFMYHIYKFIIDIDSIKRKK